MPNGSELTSSSDAHLTLTTLGGWSVASAASAQPSTPTLGPSKPLALLVFLALSPGRRARREQLLDLLWADLDPTAAAHALRQTVWYLRRRTGADLFASKGDQVALNCRVETDRDAFLAAVEAQDLDRAVALYTGDFLPGFAAPGGAEFERWADLERDRLRNTFVRTAKALARQRLDTGRARDAVALARRARDADPTAEPGWRLLIEALVCAGDRIGAAVEADHLSQWLVAEAREPEPATRLVLRLVDEAEAVSEMQHAEQGNGANRKNGGAGTTGSPPSSPCASEATPAPAGAPSPILTAELVGREREFSAILAAWSEARRGGLRHIHITGAPGLGKTRLLRDVHARLRSSGARTVLVRANPGERRVSYAFASDLAAALAQLPGACGVPTGAADTLLALSPALSVRYPAAKADSAGGDEAVRRRTIALSELVAAVADDAPLALLVDDIHWTDPLSRQVLGAIAGRVRGARLLLVTTARPTPEGTLSADGTEQLSLERLVAQQISSLLASLGALPDEPWAQELPARLLSTTGGSPLLVLETLQLLVERGLLALDADDWSSPEPGALEGVLAAGGALRRRIERLGRDQRWTLLTLAVVGTPVTTRQLLTHAARSEDAVLADLRDLEQRGLVMHSAGAWAPAHDEIAAATIELATNDALSAAHLAVGRAGVAEAGAAEADSAAGASAAARSASAAARDSGRSGDILLRAGQHLARAGAASELAVVFERWVNHSRRRGDRRPLPALALDMLGDDASAADLTRLVRTLPARIRLGLTTPRRIAAAAAIALVSVLAGGWMVLGPAAPEPDVVLLAVWRGADGVSAETRLIPLRREGWDPARPINVVRDGRRGPTAAGDWDGAVYSPARRAWALTRTMPEPDVQDLFLVEQDGSERRLMSSPGDDVYPAWAPDGSAIAFATARWNDQSWYDIAVLDLATDSVRQLTRGDAHDASPYWSPDGTRIAFIREHRADERAPRQHEICWVTPDGARESCFAMPDVRPYGLGGWADATRVLVSRMDSAGRGASVLLDVDSRAITAVLSGTAIGVLSADGRWVLAPLDVTGQLSGGTAVFPLVEPGRAVVIASDSAAPSFFLRWGKTATVPPHLSRLRVAAPAVAIPLTARYRLNARGLGPSGEAVPARLLRWWSADSSIATVTDSGEVTPLRPGSVTIHVTAGGWRSDSVRVTVGAARATNVLSESWRARIEDLWRPFGIPRPVLVSGPGGVPSFLNNGDGRFSSGSYSARTFDASSGLGVDVSMSTPATSGHWQSVTIELDSDLDSAALARWDHSEKYPQRTGEGQYTQDRCGAAVPGGEGAAYSGLLQVTAGARYTFAPLSRAHRDGRWYRLRVQLFPDGSCGVAVEGRPVWVSGNAIDLSRRFHVVLQGNSVGTRMLVGPLEVWEGVRGDMDWRQVGARSRR